VSDETQNLGSERQDSLFEPSVPDGFVAWFPALNQNVFWVRFSLCVRSVLLN